MTEKFCRFYTFGSCPFLPIHPQDHCEKDEEYQCKFRQLLGKCIIVEGWRDENCDILNWKSLIPQGYACAVIVISETSKKGSCILRIKPELRVLIDKFGLDMDHEKLMREEVEEIIQTIEKFVPQTLDSFYSG
jgi:hypothetical protein